MGKNKKYEMSKEESAFALALKLADIPLTSHDVKMAFKLAFLAKEKAGEITLMDIAKILDKIESEKKPLITG